MIQRSQQANQNRKLNALRGVVQDELGAMNAPQQAPQLTPGDYNSNGWQSAFHSMENPMAQFNAGTSDTAPSVTPQANNNYPTQADIQGIIARNLASKRFSMLDPKLVQETLTPYLQAAESARTENMRKQFGDDLMNATDGMARRNLLWGGYGRGLTPLEAVREGQSQMIADRPAPVSFNTGGNIVYGNRDPITGQITLDENKIPMELTSGQVQQNAQFQQTFDNSNRIDDRNFNAAQQQAEWERGFKEREFDRVTQPKYAIQAIDGKLWWVGDNPNVQPQPFMIDGKHANAPQMPANTKFSEATTWKLKKIESEKKYLNDRLRNLETQHAKAYGRDKDEIQQQINKIQEQIRELDDEFNSILYPPQNTQNSAGRNTNTPDLMPHAQLGNSEDIGLNMLGGARNVTMSSAFNSPRPEGRKHKGVDYKTNKGEHILVPDVGTALTVKSVVND
ncbi:MAG: hypothetical protein IJQ56_08990, partial [Synergistaceae bacterium]|nr:hypothetical protein [Synergistaceae bacterium]